MARIMVVEDEIIVARSIAKMLGQNGHDVPVCVTSGDAAIAAAATLHPDLILMDIHLRGAMNGVEAARRIREAADVPIVFLTAYADREHVDGAKLSAPHGYLLKPYSDRELLTTIEVSLHRHQLERELRERARWLGTTLRSLGDGVVAVDPALRVTFLNSVAEQLTGWRSAEAVGRPVAEVLRLVAEDTGQPRELPLARAIRDGTTLGTGGRTLLWSRDDSRLPVEESVAAIVDDAGRRVGGVVVIRDVAERRVLETRLAIAERMASLATLTAGMGHELNNPLTSNLGNLELIASILPQLGNQVAALAGPEATLLARAAEDALLDIAELVAEARTAAERMRDILGSLRQLGRPDDGQRRPVAVSDVVETALRLTANERDLRAVTHRDLRGQPQVAGHEGRLLQVISNLLVNAAQAIPEGAARGAIHVVVDETADAALIEIRDSGVGIPADVMVRIFEPFFTTKPVGVGSGLGLAIAHGIVAAHHGTIAVSSKVGEGSTFQVRLPRLAPAPPVVAAPTAVGARRDVLIVDDDDDVGRLLQRLLEDDHEVRLAASGRAALAMIAEREPDVILCDLMMPEMTGVQLHDALRAARPALAARMLFHTGGAFTAVTQAFVAEVADRVLYKPVPPDVLLAAIARVPR